MACWCEPATQKILQGSETSWVDPSKKRPFRPDISFADINFVGFCSRWLLQSLFEVVLYLKVEGVRLNDLDVRKLGQ